MEQRGKQLQLYKSTNMSKATTPKTFIERVIASGFKEVNRSGEVSKDTDYSHGWNSLDGRKRHLHLVHKNGKRVEMELVSNGGGDPLQRVALYDGDKELLVTHTGEVTNEELLNSFLG